VVLNFIDFFCIYWGDQEFLSLLLFMCYITFFDLQMLNLPLHPWDEANLIMMNDYSANSWYLISHYFIEDIYIHQCPLRRLACRSFWSIVAFIVMKCLSLSCLTNIILKSTLPDVNIATPAYLGGPWVSSIFQPFSIRQCLFLSIRCVSYKQQIFLFNPVTQMVTFFFFIKHIRILLLEEYRIWNHKNIKWKFTRL
jgi:hypothetical protein